MVIAFMSANIWQGPKHSKTLEHSMEQQLEKHYHLFHNIGVSEGSLEMMKKEFIDSVLLALQVCLFSATMAPEILDMTTILGI